MIPIHPASFVFVFVSQSVEKDESESNDASAANIIDKVVENLLGDALNDPELQEMGQIFEQFGDVLSSGPPDALTGFASGIANLHAEYLASDRKKKLVDQLREVDEFFQQETSRIKRQHEKATSKLAAWRAKGGIKQTNEQHERYQASRIKLESMEKTLKANGFTDDISVESMNELEKKLRSLEEEMHQLHKQLEPFEGLEISEHAVRRSIQQKREEIEKVEASLVNGSVSFM